MKFTFFAFIAASVACVTAWAVPTSAASAEPLMVGKSAPSVVVRDVQGSEISLADVYAEKPTALIFYRGGWCPYCTRHLSDVQKVKSALDKMGFQVVAMSPDRPEKLKETIGDRELDYTLLSDSSADAMKAFGVAFKVEESLVKKYKDSYKIDIEADSGETHNILPVPALFLVGTDGEIHFAHTDPNYRERLKAATLLEEIRKVRALELGK